MYLKRTPMFKSLLRLALATLVLAITSTTPALATATRNDVPVAISAPATPVPRFRVTAAALNVRAAPGMSGRILGTLRGGTVVTIDEFRGEWMRINFRGRAGWIARRFTVLHREVNIALTPLASYASPVRVRGSFDIAPFENTLNWRITDSRGRTIGEGFTTATSSDVGGPGSFDFNASYRTSRNQTGTLWLYEISAANGDEIPWKHVRIGLVANGG
jgi:SH3-like domain-containing protein